MLPDPDHKPKVLAPFGQASSPLIALAAALVPRCEGELKGKRKTETGGFCLRIPTGPCCDEVMPLPVSCLQMLPVGFPEC